MPPCMQHTRRLFQLGTMLLSILLSILRCSRRRRREATKKDISSACSALRRGSQCVWFLRLQAVPIPSGVDLTRCTHELSVQGRQGCMPQRGCSVSYL
jgi:hypothetical protein